MRCFLFFFFPSVTRMFSKRTMLTKSSFSSPGLLTPEIQEKVFFFLFFWPQIPNLALLRTARLLLWAYSQGGSDKSLFSLSEQGIESSSSVLARENCSSLCINTQSSYKPLDPRVRIHLLWAKTAK